MLRIPSDEKTVVAFFLTIPIRDDDGKMSVIPHDGCSSTFFPPLWLLRSQPLCTKSSGSVMIKAVVCKNVFNSNTVTLTATATPFPSSSTTLLPFVFHGANANLPTPLTDPSWQSCFSARFTWCTWKSYRHSSGRRLSSRGAWEKGCGAQTERRALCEVAAAHRGGASRQAQTGSVNATHLKFPRREQLLTCVLITEWCREKKRERKGERAEEDKRAKDTRWEALGGGFNFVSSSDWTFGSGEEMWYGFCCQSKNSKTMHASCTVFPY